jgi:hypothetical protein
MHIILPKMDNRLLKVISILAVLLIFYNLFILITYNPIGYILNIYTQLPYLFWFGSSIIYFIGCFLIFSKKIFYKTIGIIVSLLNFIIILLVPYLLGYYSYGWDDELSHIGEINNIIKTGNIDPLNLYPATHIVYSSVAIVGNFKPNNISLILPSFFTLIFVFGMYIFVRKFFKNYTIINTITIPISLIFYFGHFDFSNVPNYTYFALIPIILYIIFEYNDKKNACMGLLISIFTIIAPFEHPFICAFIIYIMTSLIIFNFFYKKSNSHLYIIILILILTFLIWGVYNVGYVLNIHNIVGALFNADISSVATKSSTSLGKLNLNVLSLFKLVIIYYGRYVLPFAFIIVSLFLIIKNKVNVEEKGKIKFFIMLTLSFGIFEAILMFNPIISHSIDRISNLNYIVFAMIPLFAISLKYLFMGTNSKSNKILLLSISLTVIYLLSLYGTFYSPYIDKPNIQVTYNEVTGMSWLFNHNNNSLPILDIMGDMGTRYSQLLYGWSSTQENQGKSLLWGNAEIEDHFGYLDSPNYSNKNEYLIITTQEELLYETVYANIARFNPQDFERFRNDSNIDKLYDSRNIQIYKS